MTVGGRIGVLLLAGAAIVGAVALATKAPTLQKPMNVSGTVQDEGGTAVGGATVRVICSSAKRESMGALAVSMCEGTSDSRGEFRVECRPRKDDTECELTVVKTGFSQGRLKIQKTQATPVVIVLRLEAGV
jgi:hypothetical protein